MREVSAYKPFTVPCRPVKSFPGGEFEELIMFLLLSEINDGILKVEKIALLRIISLRLTRLA